MCIALFMEKKKLYEKLHKEYEENTMGKMTIKEVKGDPENILVAEDDVIRIEFANIGEGWNGEYNPKDPEDENLIRFYAYYCMDNIWYEVTDGSYCTMTPVNAPMDELKSKIKKVFDRYRDNADEILAGCSVKRLGEELSYI